MLICSPREAEAVVGAPAVREAIVIALEHAANLIAVEAGKIVVFV
jgi:hypothetical protein